MNDQPQQIDLQIDHPEVDDLQEGFQPESVQAHVLSLIHRWPYQQLKVQAQGKNVLELGCNKGYGTIIYADSVNSVKAVDTSAVAIDKANRFNTRDNVEYVHLDSWTLPFADNTFDTVALFQVIEHIALDKLDIFLREIKRVVRSDGEVIITTPNRNIRLLPFQKPWNEFHTREYSAQDLQKLLEQYFAEVQVQGLFGDESLNRIERKRVKQKISKIYIKQPLRKYLLKPISRWFAGKPKDANQSSATLKAKKVRTKSRQAVTDAAHANYPFTMADLELREEFLHKALDLTATVHRVE